MKEKEQERSTPSNPGNPPPHPPLIFFRERFATISMLPFVPLTRLAGRAPSVPSREYLRKLPAPFSCPRQAEHRPIIA